MPNKAKVLLQLKQLISGHVQEYLGHQIDISLQQIRRSQQKATCAAPLLVFAPAQLPVTSAMRMEKVDQSRREANTSSTSSLMTTGMQPCRTASSALGLQPSPAAGRQQRSWQTMSMRAQAAALPHLELPGRIYSMPATCCNSLETVPHQVQW